MDDQPLVRAGLTRILSPEADLQIVGECEDGDEVEAAVLARRPDVVLMDVRMKRMDGAEATRRLQDLDGPPPVLVLTTFDDDGVLSAALGSGVAGFILKDARGEDLLQAVRQVAGGGGWLDPAVAGRVIASYRTTGLPRVAARSALSTLTEREREVLRLIGRGSTNVEIAQRLGISEGTVKSHIGHIFTKLDLRDRAAAIVFGFDHGLVEPGG
ncbi:MAG: response regulator transcription factor [Acidimicrobiales bacterium]